MYTSALYEYSGSETDYAAIVADTGNFTASTAYEFGSNTTVKIPKDGVSEATTIINNGSLTAGSLVIKDIGVFVNFGTVTLSYGLTNNGTVINYGNFTAAGASSNNGAITNESGAVFNFTSGPTVSNSNSATITNYGTMTGNAISNYGTIVNYASLFNSVSGSGTYTNNATVDESIYYWIGSNSGGTWTDSSNWSHTDGGSALTSGYPGSANGDTAVFGAGASASNFTVAENVSSITITNSAGVSGTRATIVGMAENYTGLTITVSGNFLLDGFRVGTFQTNEAAIQVTNSVGISYSLQATNMSIDSSSEVFGYIGDTFYISGNLEISGKLYFTARTNFGSSGSKRISSFYVGNAVTVTSSGTIDFPADNDYGELTSTFDGTITIESSGKLGIGGTADFNGSVENGGNLDLRSGSFTFNGAVTNNSSGSFYMTSGTTAVCNSKWDNYGNIHGGSGTIMFYGAYKGYSGSGCMPGAQNYFFADADFSESQAFGFGTGKFYAYNLSTDGTYTTFKTPDLSASGVAYTDFYFAGNVEIVLSRDISITNLGMYGESSDYYLSKSFTSKITGEKTLTVSGGFSLTRASGENGVIGTLELDCSVVVTGTGDTGKALSLYSGTALVINRGKTLEIDSIYTSSSAEYSVALQVDGELNYTGSDDFGLNYGNIRIGSSGTLNASNAEILVNNNAATASGIYNAAKIALGLSDDIAIIVDGTITSSGLTMSGTSDNPLIVDGDGQFVVTGGDTSFTGTYLKVGSSVQICETKGNVQSGAYSVSSGAPLEGTDSSAYAAVYANGWNFGSTNVYVWKGGISSAWNISDNWWVLTGDGVSYDYAPASPNSDDAIVTIPSSSEYTNAPVLTVSGISVGTLTVESGGTLTFATDNFYIYSGYSGSGTLAFVSGELDIAHGLDITIRNLNVSGAATFNYIDDGGTTDSSITVSAATYSTSASITTYVDSVLPGGSSKWGTLSIQNCTVTVTSALSLSGTVIINGTFIANGNISADSGVVFQSSSAVFTPAQGSTIAVRQWDNQAGGTFNHNKSTVEVEHTGTIYSGNKPFYNLTIYGSVMNDGADIIVLGNGDFTGIDRTSGTTDATFVSAANIYFYNMESGTHYLSLPNIDTTDTAKHKSEYAAIYFSGDVEIALNNDFYCSNMYMNVPDSYSAYTQSSPFTAKITTGDYTLTTTLEAHDYGTGAGTIEIDGTVDAQALVNLGGGTVLLIDSGSTVIAEDSIVSYANESYSLVNNGSLDVAGSITGTPQITNTGTISVVETLAASSLSNSHKIALTGGTSQFTFTSYTGASDMSDTVTCAGGAIVASDASANGTIGNLSLSGAPTTVGYASGSDSSSVFKLGSVTIGTDSSDTLASLSAGANLSVSNGFWVNNAGATGFVANSHSVEFLSDTMLSGETTFYDFICQTAGAELSFEAGKTQTVTNTFTVQGTDGSVIVLQSASDGSEWTIDAPVNSASVSYVWVTDSISVNDSIIAENSEDLGNNTNWNFKGVTYTWTGADATSPTDWHTKKNWDKASVPGSLAHVLIPDDVTSAKYPTVASAASITNLAIGTASASSHTANVTLSDSLTTETLTVLGTLTNYGTIDYAGTARIVDVSAVAVNDVANGGTVAYSGPSQTITDFGDVDYANLKIMGAGWLSSAITVAENLTVAATGSLGGYQTLSVQKNAEISGAVGANVRLESLSVTGSSSIGADISADYQTYTGNVTLSSDVSIGGGSSVAFLGTVDGSHALTLSGGYISFAGDVGLLSPLTSLSVSLNGTDVGGVPEYALSLYGVSVKTSGDQSYSGYVNVCGSDKSDKTVSGSSSLISTTGDITFGDAVFNDGRDNAALNSLSVTANAGSVTLASSVGTKTNNALKDVAISAQTVLLSDNITVKTTGTQTYTAASVTGTGSFTADGASVINSDCTFRASSLSFERITTEKTLTLNATTIHISDDSSYGSLSLTGAGATVSFGAGKTQTVTGAFSAAGTSSNPILLTTDAASPSRTDESTWWILTMPNFSADDATASFPAFTNTHVSYARAVNDIAHAWDTTVSEGERDSTINWFLTTFYWLGTTDSSWTNAKNWAYDSEGTGAAGFYPSYDTGKIDIIIATADDGNDLVLSDAVSLKSLTVNAEKTIDLKGYTVSTDDSDDTTADFINNGTVRLYGASGQISSSVENGTDSTIEYYADTEGDFVALAWGTSYANLVFGANVSRVISEPITVTGTTDIQNGAGNALSLTGANSFGGLVSIGDTSDSGNLIKDGAIVLNAASSFSLGEVYCDSLEVQCSVSFTSNVASSVTFTGENAHIAGGVSFSEAVSFSGNGATVSGDSTFTDVTLTASTTFTGSNSFASFVCETGGQALSFGEGTAQAVTGALTLTGDENARISFGGTGEWTLTASDVSRVSLSHTVVTNSNNTSAEKIIVYARDGYNVDGTGNTNWIFAGQQYVWTAQDATNAHDWNTSANWSPASVPKEYAEVVIPPVSSLAYPVLTEDLNLENGEKTFEISGSPETVTSSIQIEESAVFDFNGFNLTVHTLSNAGRIRVRGSETLAASGTAGIVNFPLNENGVLTGIIEYYDDFGTALNWGSRFTQLEFTAGATGTVSDAISVSGTTLIANGSDKSLTLSGANQFGALVTLGSASEPAGTIALSGANTFASGIALVSSGDTVLAGSDSAGGAFTVLDGAQASSLTVNSDVAFAGVLTTTTGALTINANADFSGAVSSGESISVSGTSSFAADVTSTLAQAYTGAATLLADVRFLAGANTVSFGSTLDSGAGTNHSLTVGNETNATNAVFAGTVGATASLSSLTVWGNAELHADVTATAAQTYRGAVSVRASPSTVSAQTVTYNGDVSGQDATSDALVVHGAVTLTSALSFAQLLSLEFADSVTTDYDVTFSAASLVFDSSFTQNSDESSSTIPVLRLASPTACVFGVSSFSCGILSLAADASFVQTGVNAESASQRVRGIETAGTCVWDSASEGGTLSIAGDISGEKASSVLFNKKNVTLEKNCTISGVFFDLTIPESVALTNGTALAVRRNFTVNGSYVHADNPLTLGTVTVDGTVYASGENDGGEAGEISCASSNLGAVTVVQGETAKLFTTAIQAVSLSLDDTTTGAGSVQFGKKLTVTTLTNTADVASSGAETIDFDIVFSEGITVTDALTLSTAGTVTLGSEAESECSFGAGLTHTAGTTRMAGVLSSSADCALRDALLLNDVTFLAGTNTVSFARTVDGSSDDSSFALVFGNGTNATNVRFDGAVGSSHVPSLLTVWGNAAFGGSVSASGIITLKGGITAHSSDDVLLSGLYILADGSASRTWRVSSGTLTCNDDMFINIAAASSVDIQGTITLKKKLCVYSGALSLSHSTLSVASDVVIFGSSYNADDPRFTGADTRFAYFGYENLAYTPADDVFAASLASTAATIATGGNLYINGADVTGFAFELPDNAASHPEFNASAAVTETQWGTPYAVVFNASVAQSSATCTSGEAVVAASTTQGCTDGGDNTGFQFAVPHVSEAYSVSDAVLCLSFDMAIENSQGEAAATVALVSSLENGGIFYNGGALCFDGVFYTESDGTNCSVPLADSDYAEKDIPALTKLYLKVASTDGKWNTDATAASLGTAESTDRSGTHRAHTIDLSLMEGMFYAASGKTMSKNYGTGLWKEDGATEYTVPAVVATLDKARPVLVEVSTGQELHTDNTGVAESQAYYDAHNFIEFKYSEPVNIGNLASGATSDNQNVQAQDTFDSASSHGGALSQTENGITVAGFASIAGGKLTAGVKSTDASSPSGTIDTAKPHALYRKFALSAGERESVQPSRLRISIAGYVDTEHPVSYGSGEFLNWIGYIDESETPSGLVTPTENAFITDCAKDADGNALSNTFDESNDSLSVTVNANLTVSASSLYGDWDCLAPAFATYVTTLSDTSSVSTKWTTGDSAESTTQYEIVGTVNSNTSAYLDRVEMHLFDNMQNYASDDTYKWVSQNGWTTDGTLISNHSAPDTTGGSRGFVSGSGMTGGGIRRGSLAGAQKAFAYTYRVDTFESDSRSFADAEVSQNVKSSLFRNESLTTTSTADDGLYLALNLNEGDIDLPIRTTFTLTYTPAKSFITDLAGNRLIQTDAGSDVKVLHSVDITPPSVSMLVSPIGENKIYAVFTKQLAYEGETLAEHAQQSAVFDKIKTNIEFVYSEDDNIDTTKTLTGDDELSVESVSLAANSPSYTALLFTLNRAITLTDVEHVWLRINGEGDDIEAFAGIIKTSFIQDENKNGVPFHTCHAISDFALSAADVVYAYAAAENDNWDEQGIYGNESGDGYAVHDFSADAGNYGRLLAGRDIVFQIRWAGSKDEDGYNAPDNGEQLALVLDKKSHIADNWLSSKFNQLTESDWRIWVDSEMDSLSYSYNTAPMSVAPVFEDVDGSELLKNMTISNSDAAFEANEEYQFFFKVLDKNGDEIKINHDGDSTTADIPLYAFRFPQEHLASGDFSFVDLWSFSISSIVKQRGGVSILNNVINASVGEKTALEVTMKSTGSLNIYVMTLDGNIIKRLEKGTVSEGTHYYYWDGTNNAGSPVARGLYFIRVSGKGIDETRKVMVIKK